MKYPFVIQSCKRAGSLWMSEVLTESGIPCGHESNFEYCSPEVGSYGHVGVVGSGFSVYHTFERYRWAAVLHQVRDPINTINSCIYPNFDDEFWGRQATDLGVELPTHDSYLRAGLYYVLWNRMCAKRSEWRYRVEDIREGSSTWSELCRRLGVEEDLPLVSPPIRNRRGTSNPTPRVEWEYFEAYPNLFRDLRDLAEKYGYVGKGERGGS